MPVRNLVRWERWVAGIAGVAAAGAGGYSVFVSDNQAGTTALMVFGALFLLIAVQGTAIRRATRESVEMDPRVAEVAMRAEEVLEDRGPGEAAAFIEGAKTSDPAIESQLRFHILNPRLYDQQVLEAVDRIALEAFNGEITIDREVRRAGFHFDALIRSTTPPVRELLVEAMYSRDRPRSDRLDARRAQSLASGLPGIIVTNRQMANFQADTWAKEVDPLKLQFVLWRGPEDDKALFNAIDRLLNASRSL